MKKDFYRVVGVMSGTSLDGIDLVLCEFQRDAMDQWTYALSNAKTLSYSNDWVDLLAKALSFSEEELQTLNREYTKYLSERIIEYMKLYGITAIDAICSHGHTILHQPEQGKTLQIGNLPSIARYLGHRVVCDFRVQDVNMGGQGAPLVPIGDRLLFGDYDYCLNLGGFANISFEEKNNRLAYDICPVNVVLNALANRLGKPYDKNGSIAVSGALIDSLLNRLNSSSYYKESPPKSLGMEWVNQNILPLLDSTEEEISSLLRTYTEHIATQLANNLKSHGRVLVTGGGAYNSFLIDRLKQLTATEVILPDTSIIEFKEALIFGFLGVLRLRDEVNCLASVTGASRDHSSGNIFLP